MENELFRICCERSPNRAEQRRQLVALLKAGADIHAADKTALLHFTMPYGSEAPSPSGL
jgi:hypothetical protein